jgi:hypothetical protein
MRRATRRSLQCLRTTPVERVPAIMDVDLLPDYGQNDPMNVLNWKNALFARHDLGAEKWAVVASLIETCKLHRVVRGWPNRRLAEVTPRTWAQSGVYRAMAA